MTDSGAAGNATPSGSGCATAFGIALILAGGLLLWANLSGNSLALLFFDLLPLAAVWWPLVLVVWGAVKILTRLRTGRARFGFGEGFLLLLFILGGTVFTLAHRAIESQGMQPRMAELRRLVERQSGPFPAHVFVTEESVSLPVEGEVEILVSLPAGNIRVEAAPEADPRPEAASDPETPVQPVPDDARVEGRLRLVKRVWAADAAAAETRAAAVRLRAGPLDPETGRLPIRVEDSVTSEVALELLAILPPGVRVAAHTEDGWVRIVGPFAGVEAGTDDGPVEVRGTGGPVSLTVRNGAAWVSEIAGALAIQARRAAVEVDGVAGAATVEAEGAPVWISGAESSVTVRGRNAPVTVADSFGPVDVGTRIASITLDRIGGSAVLRSDFGSVVATSIEGPLRVHTDSASLEVRGARAGVEIQATGGSLVLDDVAGALTVHSGRGAVRASRLVGPANFTGSAGAITVRGFGSTLSVTGGDAEVDVATDTLGGGVALATDSGNVQLTLPSAGSFALAAETNRGDVDSEFTLERYDAEGRSRWEGRTGSAAEQVTVTTERGDITVRARPPAGEGR